MIWFGQWIDGTFDDSGFAVQNILRLAPDLQKSRTYQGQRLIFTIVKARIQDMYSGLLYAIFLCLFVTIYIQQISLIENFNNIIAS